MSCSHPTPPASLFSDAVFTDKGWISTVCARSDNAIAVGAAWGSPDHAKEHCRGTNVDDETALLVAGFAGPVQAASTAADEMTAQAIRARAL